MLCLASSYLLFPFCAETACCMLIHCHQLAKKMIFFFGNRIHFDNITCDELAALSRKSLFFFIFFRIHFDNITRDELAAIEQEILLLQKLRHQHIVSYMVCMYVCGWVGIYIYVFIYVYLYGEGERVRESESEREREGEREKHTHTHTHTPTGDRHYRHKPQHSHGVLPWGFGGTLAQGRSLLSYIRSLLQGFRWHTCSRHLFSKVCSKVTFYVVNISGH